MIEGLVLGLLIAMVSAGATFLVMLYRMEDRPDDGGERWPDTVPPWLTDDDLREDAG